MINIIFGLNPQAKQEFPVSNHVDINSYISADSLLKFEEISYQIDNQVEKSKYYFIVAYLLNQKLIEFNVKVDNTIEKISNLIKSYEEKLSRDHYVFAYDMPEFEYQYKYIKFSDKSVIKKVFYKQASILKSQYIKTYEAGIKKIELLSDYLFSLRENYIISRTQLVNLKYQEEFETRFYETIQDMLYSNLMEESKLEPLKIIVDNNNNVISMIEIKNINGSDIMFSKDFEYFSDGLLAANRERENGKIIKEILFGNNQYSQNFYDFIFDSNFQTLNYDNFTEIHYQLNGKINYIDFFTFNGVKIGAIEYEYDSYDRLIHEKWYKGERVIAREFNCFYETGQGSYRVVERNENGEIVFQDIVNSKNAHISIEGK